MASASPSRDFHDSVTSSKFARSAEIPSSVDAEPGLVGKAAMIWLEKYDRRAPPPKPIYFINVYRFVSGIDGLFINVGRVVRGVDVIFINFH